MAKTGGRTRQHRELACRFGVRRLRDIPEFVVWVGMRGRCRSMPNYVCRGIAVCDRWESFEDFYRDMGPRPSPAHSIDRIDNDGNYEPSNCRWATRQVQNGNRGYCRQLTIGGETMSVTEWSLRTGVPRARIKYRLTRGLSAEGAILAPKRQGVGFM